MKVQRVVHRVGGFGAWLIAKPQGGIECGAGFGDETIGFLETLNHSHIMRFTLLMFTFPPVISKLHGSIGIVE